MLPITSRVPIVALDPTLMDSPWIRSFCTHLTRDVFSHAPQFVAAHVDQGFSQIGRVVELSVVASNPSRSDLLTTAAKHKDVLFHLRVRAETDTVKSTDPVFDAEILAGSSSSSSSSGTNSGAEYIQLATKENDALKERKRQWDERCKRIEDQAVEKKWTEEQIARVVKIEQEKELKLEDVCKKQRQDEYDRMQMQTTASAATPLTVVIQPANRTPDSEAVQTTAAIVSTAFGACIAASQLELVTRQMEAAALMVSCAPNLAQATVDQARSWILPDLHPQAYRAMVKTLSALGRTDTRNELLTTHLPRVAASLDMDALNAIMKPLIEPSRIDAWCNMHPRCSVPFWCINLDRRPELWTDMKLQFDAMTPRMRVVLERFAATDGKWKDPDRVAVMNALPLAKHACKLQAAAIGCWESHRRIWERFGSSSSSGPQADAKAITPAKTSPASDAAAAFSSASTASIQGSSKLEVKAPIRHPLLPPFRLFPPLASAASAPFGDWLWVLEDDGTCHPTFQRDMVVLEQVLPALAAHVDVIWTGYHMQLPTRWSQMHQFGPPEFIPLDQARNTLSIGGTFSYLVSRRGARKLAEMTATGYRIQPKVAVDEWWRNLPSSDLTQLVLKRPLILSYFYVPNVPAPRMSDVQIPVELRSQYEPQ